ncbi:HAD family hydrolase [Pararhodobacter sp. SW119]|uniref:HAD family hydrolase n=1 Tax=Pararhodobacter sp. SW119 TaxID=2780075 RepID=UPI001ADFA120|nr:HAD family hydrolase [Pararhodobacter sp. SW119]
MTAPVFLGIRGLLFDKDGTLFDFQASWGVWAREVLDELAGPDRALADRLATVLRFDQEAGRFHRDSAVIAGTGDEIAEMLAPHLPHRPGGVAALADWLAACAARAPMVEATPLRPLLSRFQSAGLRLGLATNDYESVARAHLTSALDHFDFVVGADSGHGAKPGPGMLLAFVAHTGLLPRQVLMVGDSRHDLEAGRAAGMPTLAVLTGVAEAADLAPYADAVCQDISHIPYLLGFDPRQ